MDFVVVGGGCFGLSTALYLREAGHTVRLIRPVSTENTAHNDTSRLYRIQQSNKAAFWKTAAARSIASMKRRGVDMVECGYVGIARGDSEWSRAQEGGMEGDVPREYNLGTGVGVDKYYPQNVDAGYFDVIKWREKMEGIFVSLGGLLVDGGVKCVRVSEASMVEVEVDGEEGGIGGDVLKCEKVGWRWPPLLMLLFTMLHYIANPPLPVPMLRLSLQRALT